MYSLMLMDDVVREIDRAAYLHNTNRSNLVNQILAEYLNVSTPEMICKEVFRKITELISAEPFQIALPVSGSSLSIRSSLQYKYRPTIKYSIELYRSFSDNIGELTVAFRTQSLQLLGELAEFFNYWLGIEEQYSDCEMQYLPQVGKFIRKININGEYSHQDISRALSNYILMFDQILKNFLAKKYKTYEDIAIDYANLRREYRLDI